MEILTRSTSVRYDYSKKKESSIYKKLENKYEYYKIEGDWLSEKNIFKISMFISCYIFKF